NNFAITNEAQQKLLNKFIYLYTHKDQNFGNGRLVRNVFDKTAENQANRLVNISQLTKETMMNILPEDIPEG
ncbi:MAG: AAA family ATPase, partial [Rivularia sp. (in: cyanobacteria)]